MREATDAGFAPYGALVPVPPDGGRIALPLGFEAEACEGEARLAMNSVAPPDGPVPLLLERHPFSVQVFVPLGDLPLLSVLALPSVDRPTLADLVALRVPPRHAVVYRAGTWHLGMASLGRAGTVAVFIRRIADGSDTQFLDLEGAVDIVP